MSWESDDLDEEDQLDGAEQEDPEQGAGGEFPSPTAQLSDNISASAIAYVELVQSLGSYPDGVDQPGASQLLEMRKRMSVEDQVEAYGLLCQGPTEELGIGLLVSRANAFARAALLRNPGPIAIREAFQDVGKVCAQRGQDPMSDQLWENLAMVLFMEGSVDEGLSALAESHRADIDHVKRKYPDLRVLGLYTYCTRVNANSAGFRDRRVQARLTELRKSFGLD